MTGNPRPGVAKRVFRPENVCRCQPVALSGGPSLIVADVPAKYLTDESRRVGEASGLALPRTTAEVAAALREASARGLPVLVSGARTGISAGAVPAGEVVLSLERMNRIRGLRKDAEGRFLLHCESGVLLSELQSALRTSSVANAADWDLRSLEAVRALRTAPPQFYPPDPTETGASIGGTIACDASGAHSFRYGSTRRHIQWLKAVLADGSLLELSRGRCFAAADGTFTLKRAGGCRTKGRVPRYPQPPSKNAAGYFSGAGMDLIDLFIGSEGTLGIITEAEIALSPLPQLRCGVTLFCPSEASALQLTRSLRERREELGIEAMEYVDPAALAMLRRQRGSLGEASGVPECLPASAVCVLHLDLGLERDSLPSALESVADIAAACSVDPDSCWTALDERERERLRVFRHAVPECVNKRITEIRRTHPAIAKLGTDMAVPDEHLERILRIYRDGLARSGLEAVIFGHIGDNHLHVNILPRTPEEYESGKNLYQEFARAVVGLNGSVAAEHGVGTLKVPFLDCMLGEKGLQQMRAVKTLFDPDWRLSPRTLFGDSPPAAPDAEVG